MVHKMIYSLPLDKRLVNSFKIDFNNGLRAIQPLEARQSKLVILSNRCVPISPLRNNPMRAFAKNDRHYLWSTKIA